MAKAKLVYKGGTGSGDHGHAGRPGKVGGSASSGGSGGGAPAAPAATPEKLTAKGIPLSKLAVGAKVKYVNPMKPGDEFSGVIMKVTPNAFYTSLRVKLPNGKQVNLSSDYVIKVGK